MAKGLSVPGDRGLGGLAVVQRNVKSKKQGGTEHTQTQRDDAEKRSQSSQNAAVARLQRRKAHGKA